MVTFFRVLQLSSLVLFWTAVVLVYAPNRSMAQSDLQGQNGRKAELSTASEGASPAEDDVPRVVPAFDPGSHTRPILAMGFTSDQSKLITVGEDQTIQIWSTSTGERLDILHLPSYGYPQGTKRRVWDIAAVSPDGQYAAIGGGLNQASPKTKAGQANLFIVNIALRKLTPVRSPRGSIRVAALAFSPSGEELAVSYYGHSHRLFFHQVGAKEKLRPTVVANRNIEKADHTKLLEFSPDGKRLIACTAKGMLGVWELGSDKPRLTKNRRLKGLTTAVSWSPNGQRFVRCWTTLSPKGPHGLAIFVADGTLEQRLVFNEQQPFSRSADPWGVKFLDSNTLLLSLFDRQTTKKHERGTTAARVDLKTGRFKRLLSSQGGQASYPMIDALSSDKAYGAISVAMGLDAIVYRVRDGSIVSRCGADSPIPSMVGWAAEGRPDGFAWSDDPRYGRNDTTAKELTCGFDLSAMEPVGNIKSHQYSVRQERWKSWSLRKKSKQGGFSIYKGDQLLSNRKPNGAIISISLIPQHDKPPLVAWGSRTLFRQIGSSVVQLATCEGKQIASFRPFPVHPRDLAPSTDGRYLIVSDGTHRLSIYPTDGRRRPLLSFARVRGEWVAWSPAGYFTASPGGEKMIGWVVRNGWNKFSTFHTAERFARHFRRPELLKRVIKLGSIEAALSQVETRAPVLENILPPQCKLTLVEQTGSQIKVNALATSDIKEKPVVALRLLLNGRPISGGVGKMKIKPGEAAAATWELEIPAGTHELKLLARNEESSSLSDPLVVKGPTSVDQQPVLHRLCVGVDEYQLPALNLGSAAKDARDLFEGLEKYCVGSENRFGSAGGQVILNRQATRGTILKSLAEFQRTAKPGDLVVFHFAGHGIRQQEEYFLMTHEADPNQNLQEQSLSGSDLRQALTSMPCSVLLVLDACHSARSIAAFRPATDEVARDLTADAVGVTVMAAAMAHEVATATEENGHFTSAFLRALQLGPGVPLDPYDHTLYAHHIYSVVFTEVRKATNGKQNPFINMPWTVPPIAVRHGADEQ